jgi:hypothetical protein
MSRAAAAAPVPRSYFGLSTEYWALPLFERYRAQFERVLALTQVPGNGPQVLRIGGDSADHAILDPRVRRVPKAIFELTPTWFHQTAVLVADVGARVILDVNLVVDRPEMAALWARTAETRLPPRRIVAYEIGNEPDLYNPSYWSGVFSPLERALDITLFTSALSPVTYDAVYQRYARALAAFAAHVPLMAPAVAYPTIHTNWIRMILMGPHPGLGLISAHMYPYSACAPRSSPIYPTIAKVLSENATAGMAKSLIPAIELVHRAGFPFRLSELNSVTCGGVAGISDRFATALWAPDALFELMRRGVDGVNVHVRAYAINAAFALTRYGVVARPLLYGLTLFARTLGPRAQLEGVRVHARHRVHLKVWAVRVIGNILHVLLINKGTNAITADLLLPTRQHATVQRLLAPSASARSGVTLDGQHLGRDDIWHGSPVSESVAPGARGYALHIPPISAALLAVHLSPSTG